MDRIDVVFFKEGDDWVGQCLQYDLAAQGENLKQCVEELGAVLATRIVAASEGRIAHPFADLPPAPEQYWARYREGVKLSAGAPLLPIPPGVTPAWMIPSDFEARVF